MRTMLYLPDAASSWLGYASVAHDHTHPAVPEPEPEPVPPSAAAASLSAATAAPKRRAHALLVAVLGHAACSATDDAMRLAALELMACLASNFEQFRLRVYLTSTLRDMVRLALCSSRMVNTARSLNNTQ